MVEISRSDWATERDVFQNDNKNDSSGNNGFHHDIVMHV